MRLPADACAGLQMHAAFALLRVGGMPLGTVWEITVHTRRADWLVTMERVGSVV